MRGVAVVLLGLTTVLGMIGAALAVSLGFEEAPEGLLLLSTLGAFAIPAALLADLMLRQTSGRKRVLLRALLGRRAPQALSAYLRLAIR